MKIDEHIKNLEEYCEDDDLFEKDGDFKEFCDNHIADIKAVIEELKNTQADLYEANHRITDLLLILGDRDRIIDLMADDLVDDEKYIEDLANFEYFPEYKTKEEAIKYYEKESKNAND